MAKTMKKTPQRFSKLLISQDSSPVSITPEHTGLLRFFLCALFILSSTSACIENGLHPLVLLFVPLVVAALFRRDYSRPFFGNEILLSVAFLIFMTVVIFLAVTGVLKVAFIAPVLIAYMTLGLMMVRAFFRLSDRNIFQFIFLSFGLILVNCILTNHIIFAMILPLYLISLLGALLTFHFARHESAITYSTPTAQNGTLRKSWCAAISACALLMLVLAVILFPLLPRPFIVYPALRAMSPLSGSSGLASMRQRITYGDMINMSGRNRIAFFVKFSEGPGQSNPYWRGRVLAAFDGRTWTHERPRVRTLGFLKQPSNPNERLSYKVFPHRLHSRTVYVYGLPIAILGFRGKQLLVNSLGEARILSPFTMSDAYEVRAAKKPIPARHPIDPTYLSRSGITPGIRELAQQWTRTALTKKAKAQILVRRFQRDFTYRLRTPPPPPDVNPLEYFMLKTRQGHCEYFAGSMVLMLRSLGIPARVVEGFNGMEATSNPGEYLVRFSKAHAWVEALLDKDHWTTLDPTPPGRDDPSLRSLMTRMTDWLDRAEFMWVRRVVNFDKSDQLELAEKFSGMLFGQDALSEAVGLGSVKYLVLILGSIGLGWTLPRVIRRSLNRESSTTGFYVKTMKSLRRLGILTRVYPWHEQNTLEILKNAPDLKWELTQFMRTYLEARFGKANRKDLGSLRFTRDQLIHKAQTLRA
jgi:transglutaminase-like putative cysteine protease